MPRQKIVLFEGDKAYAKILKETLTIEGFDVLCFDHVPDKCEDRVYEMQTDLIVVDAMLPDTDGFHLASRLKTDLRIRNIPIVFLSSLGHPTDIQRGREVGAADYILKTKHGPREIADRIKILLGQPTQKSAPRARITRLPDIPESLTPKTQRVQRPFPAGKTLAWIAGIVVIIIVAVQLSTLFQSRPKAAVNEIPIEYLEPTACIYDDDCVIRTECCASTGVNIYHDQEAKEQRCPAVLCPNINVGVACVHRQCAVVQAQEQIRGRIIYASHTVGSVAVAVEEYDCARRAGEYQACAPACPDGSETCTATCSASCLLPNEFLPIPQIRIE